MSFLLSYGDSVYKRYEIVAQVDDRGRGEVYRVYDSEKEETAALKVVFLEGEITETMLEGFHDRVDQAKQLTHQSSVELFTAKEAPRGYLFYTSEWVEGRSLQQDLEEGPPWSPAAVGEILVQALESLVESHQRGLIHGDLKPTKIMRVDNKGAIKLLDFGIARTPLTDPDINTMDARYLAPEQIEGEEPTPMFDLYSLGLIGIDLISGELREAARNESPEVQPEVRESALGDLLVRAVQWDPADRFQTADEMLDAVYTSKRNASPDPVVSVGEEADGADSSGIPDPNDLGAPKPEATEDHSDAAEDLDFEPGDIPDPATDEQRDRPPPTPTQSEVEGDLGKATKQVEADEVREQISQIAADQNGGDDPSAIDDDAESPSAADGAESPPPSDDGEGEKTTDESPDDASRDKSMAPTASESPDTTAPDGSEQTSFQVIAVIIAGLVAALLVGLSIFGGSDESETSTDDRSTADQSAADEAPTSESDEAPSPSSDQPQVAVAKPIRITSNTEAVEIRSNDVKLGTTPLEVKIERETTLTVEKNGHDKQLTLTMNSPGEVEITFPGLDAGQSDTSLGPDADDSGQTN